MAKKEGGGVGQGGGSGYNQLGRSRPMLHSPMGTKKKRSKLVRRQLFAPLVHQAWSSSAEDLVLHGANHLLASHGVCVVEPNRTGQAGRNLSIFHREGHRGG